MTKLFFAGAEYRNLAESLAINGVKRILVSFYYISMRGRENFVNEMQCRYPDIQWFLDSGAYTYAMAMRNPGSEGKILPTDEFVSRYFHYIDEKGSKFCRIAEPDFDNNEQTDIDEKKVRVWREVMLSQWPTYPITPVWNGFRRVESWDEYCDDVRIKHLAISGGYMKNIGHMAVMAHKAHRCNKTVHGFGVTKSSILQKVQFDTIDSTTWFASQKFGVIYVWRGNKMFAHHSTGKNKKNRRKFAQYFKAIGCDVKKITDDDTAEVRKCNINSWRIFGERLEEVQKRKDWCISRVKEDGATLKERCAELREDHARLLERLEGS